MFECERKTMLKNIYVQICVVCVLCKMKLTEYAREIGISGLKNYSRGTIMTDMVEKCKSSGGMKLRFRKKISV